jgi:hypothetical protein
MESLAFIICLLLSLFHKNSANFFSELLRYINHEESQFSRPLFNRIVWFGLLFADPDSSRRCSVLGARLAPYPSSPPPTRQDLQCQQRNNVRPPNGGEDS